MINKLLQIKARGSGKQTQFSVSIIDLHIMTLSWALVALLVSLLTRVETFTFLFGDTPKGYSYLVMWTVVSFSDGRRRKSMPQRTASLVWDAIWLPYWNMPSTFQPGFLVMGCTLYVNLKNVNRTEYEGIKLRPVRLLWCRLSHGVIPVVLFECHTECPRGWHHNYKL